jgi:multisubunit Na+/H+ antiporter MnhB subunit
MTHFLLTILGLRQDPVPERPGRASAALRFAVYFVVGVAIAAIAFWVFDW